jgi:hypothetical protein
MKLGPTHEGLRVLQKRAMSRIPGRYREDVRERYSKLHNEEIQDFCTLSNFIAVKVKEN